MRIIKKSSQLSIRNQDSGLARAIGFGILLVGLTLVGSGFSSPVKGSLICNRNDNNKISCALTKSVLIAESNAELIDDLQGAKVEEGGSRTQRTYEIVLQTDSGEVSFLTNADEGSDNIVSSINDFVVTPKQQTLRIQATAWGHIIRLFLTGVLSAGVCLGMILLIPIKTCTFDKSSKKVILKKKSFIKTEKFEYPLHALLDLKAYKNDDGKGYQIVLFLRDYKDLHLNAGSVSKRHAEKVVDKIKDFLK